MSQRDYVTSLRSPSGESRLWNVFSFYIPYYLPVKGLAFSTSTKRACAISLQEYSTLLFPLVADWVHLTPSLCDWVLAIGRSPLWSLDRGIGDPPLVCLHGFIAPKLLSQVQDSTYAWQSPDCCPGEVQLPCAINSSNCLNTFKTRERATRLEDGRFI